MAIRYLGNPPIPDEDVDQRHDRPGLATGNGHGPKWGEEPSPLKSAFSRETEN